MERKPNRLKEFDYNVGAYFVTICTHDRKRILSEINVGEGLAPPVEVRLTGYGKIVEEQLLDLERRYPTVRIDQYVIMPDHVHAIIRMEGGCGDTGGASPSPTLLDAIRVFKSMTARLCNKVHPVPQLWQRSFYDHVIRGDADYREIWEYIENNPRKWQMDRYYTEPADKPHK